MIAPLLALALSAAPDHVRLGRDPSAEISVTCAQEPRFFPSAGTVDDPWSDGAAWHATFTPPHGSLPRVALVAVLCGAEPGLLPIPLWGEGDAEVHASPRSVVEVRIGGELFGPLRTDATGVARVPVVVPPGEDFAYQGPRAIDLHVPRSRTVQLVAAEDELAVDAARTVALYAFAVDRSGAPLQAAPLRLSASRGELSAPVAVAPGVYRIDWSFGPGAPGEATAQATVEGDSQPASATLALTAGAPNSVELTAERYEIVAGEGPVRLRALVRDAAGNFVDPAVRATANLGTLRLSRGEPGHYELEAQVPGALEGSSELRIAVLAGAARAESAIALRPGSPARVRIDAARPSVLADGRSAVRVRLRALDRFGNEVPDAPAASSSLGSVSAVARGARGWEATYVPPVLHDRGSALVDARTGPAAATARIELDPAVRPLAVAFRAGLFSNFHEAKGPIAGLVASLRTDWLGSQLGVQASLDALGWNVTSALQTSAGGRQLRTAMGVLMPAASLEWRLPLSERAAAWAAAGPMLAFASAQTQLAGAFEQRDRGVEPGLQGGAGAELRVWRGRALFELRWLAVRSFALANLSGPLSGLCATAGYRVELF